MADDDDSIEQNIAGPSDDGDYNEANLPQPEQPTEPSGEWSILGQSQERGDEWDVQTQDRKDEKSGDQPPYGPSQEEPSALGSAIRGVARSIIPTTAAVLGGVGAATLAAPTAPFTAGLGPLAAGIGAGAIAGHEVSNLQDSITDTLGLDSPESRAADARAHPYVTTAAEIAPALVTLQPGATAKTLSGRLTQRVLTGGILGGTDALNQYATKGTIDPTETAISAAGGAALPTLRPWAEGLVGSRQPHAFPKDQEPTPEAQKERDQMSSASPSATSDSVGTSGIKAAPSGSQRPFQDQYAKGNLNKTPQPGDQPGQAVVVGDANMPVSPAEKAALSSADEDQQIGQQIGQPGSQEQPTAPTVPPRAPPPPDATPQQQGAQHASQYADLEPHEVAQEAANRFSTPAEQQQFQRGYEGTPEQQQLPPTGNEAWAQKNVPNWKPSSNPLVDNSYTVRSIANSAKDPEGPVYIDPRVPEFHPNLTQADGNPLNIHNELALHETQERIAELDGKAYPEAHTIAEAAEKADVVARGGGGPAGEKLYQDYSAVVRAAGEPIIADKSPGVPPPEELASDPNKDVNHHMAKGASNEMPPGAAAAVAAGKKVKAARQPKPLKEQPTFPTNTISLPKERAPGSNPNAELAPEGPKEPTNSSAQAEIPFETATPDDLSIPPFLQRPKPQSLSAGAGEAPSFARAEIAKQTSKLGDAVKNFGPVKWFRTAFTPEGLTDNTKEFEKLIGEGQGRTNEARLQYDRNQLNLERAINNTAPEARDNFARNFQTGQLDPNNPLSRLSSSALENEKSYQKRLNDVDPDGDWQRSFLPNIFQDTDGAKDFATQWADDNTTKVPNGRDKNGKMKYKSVVGVPTIGDFMNNGFKLQDSMLRQDGSVDPVQMLQGLHSARDSFLESKYIVNKALDDDHGLFFRFNAPGTEPLQGLTSIYAEPEVALMWNRYHGPNAMDVTGKDFLNTVQKIKNSTTSFQLLGGAYHLVAETGEAVTGDVMRAISQAAAGRFSEAGKKLVGAVAAPIRQATTSANAFNLAYYEPKKALPEVRQAVEYLIDAGVTPKRMQRYTPEFNITRGFFEGFHKAANQMDLNELKEQAQQGVGGATKSTFQLIGKGMQTVMEPLFNTYIPRLKIGAMLEQMQDYIAANPDKTADEYQTMAIRIRKSTEDRLGELNQSMLFWNRTLKKAANLLMISPGWETGTLRAAFGGTKSLVTNPGRLSITHPDFQPNAAWPFAFAITTAAIGSMYQYMKTGQPPADLEDPFFPKTGGKATNSQQPERAILPGYLKDVYSWWHGLTGAEGMQHNASSMLYNKLAMVPRTTWDMMANKDWAGKQIANPNDPLQKRMQEYLNYVQRNMMPIAAGQVMNPGINPASKISAPERFTGIRHAPSVIEKPAAVNEAIRKSNNRDAAEAKKFHTKTGL